ncbi:MAG: DUF4922 domain-containing protein [Bacteroidota bacterium]
MLSQKTFAHYPDNQQRTLRELSLQLYSEQQRQWPMLADGVAALRFVRIRDLDCGPFTVRLQYNPRRIVSTAANVDAVSVKARRCFLCLENLPLEQSGIVYREKFLLLCNPMPVFKEHFTISHIDHIPQSIEEKILSLLSLAKDLSPEYSVFYNGPACGASAPDHMHFQAAPMGEIPAEREVGDRLKLFKRSGGAVFSTVEHYGRSVMVLDSDNEKTMELAFLRMCSSMRKVMKTADEPMMNVIGSYADGMWRLIVFVRRKHRPSVYFKTGEDKIIISPAAVDIGGLVVTPMEKDFHSVDASMITSIFEEVSVTQETLVSILDAL